MVDGGTRHQVQGKCWAVSLATLDAPDALVAHATGKDIGADGMGFEPMEPCQRLDRFTVGWFKPLTNPSAVRSSGGALPTVVP